ncbi:MAG: lytic murein transglycosylase [Actinomycetota bacterium]|nr:lytic murein transglycosylase [Actinomycetota bacterium]
MRALVQSLEAFVARAGQLRTATAGAEAALDGAERELDRRRRHEDETQAATRRLRSRLADAEAELLQLEIQRREDARRPSPPPRTLPLLEGDRAGAGRAGSMAYQHLLRARGEVLQRIDADRQQLRVADHAADEAKRAVAAHVEEVERHRQALTALREELARVPSEAQVAASLAVLGDGGEGPRPSTFGLADIPAEYLDLYRRAAATCPGLPWTVLAAIGSAESSHGRSSLPGVGSGANSAGAMGPMQFLADTWAAYGVDGDGDGGVDVYRPADAVFGAANYLCASGAGDPSRLAEAIWAYNHADWYVTAVLSRAAAYGTAGLGTVPADAAALVAHPNLTLTGEARADLLSGVADGRVVAALAAAAAEHRIEVSVIKTGHATFVRGTDRVSNHYHGRAVDIVGVDGMAVSESNQAALSLALALLTADPALRPDELGSPWPHLTQFPGAFSDADHAGHLHVGWRAVRTSAPAHEEGAAN